MALTQVINALLATPASGGTDWVATIQTGNFTAEAGKGYFVNTTSAAITITLPAGVVGKEILIQDYAGTFATNNAILSANGSEKIQGVANDFKCVTDNATVTLIYQDATRGWTANNIQLNLPPLTVNWLIVAGGGGGATGWGGIGSGGGGAGGLRTSWPGGSGGGAGSESSLNLSVATNYDLTVGGAGAGPSAGNGATAANGASSTFNGISSNGGGGAKSYSDGGASSSSADGGSGGGGTYITIYAGNGSTSQGNGGGSGTASGSAYGGGGGGGAAASGNGGNGSNGVTGGT